MAYITRGDGTIQTVPDGTPGSIPGNPPGNGSPAPSSSPSSSGVFNPAAQVAATVGGASTYDPFGLPTGMGDERIYVGYNAGEQTYTAGRRVEHGDEGAVVSNKGGVTNQTVSVNDLLQHFADMAKSTNPYTRQTWSDVQKQLQASGAYGSSTRINYGTWTTDDAKALQTAIQGYLQGSDQGKLETFEEYLKSSSAQGAANGLDSNQPGGPGSGNQRAPLSLTNDADLNQALDNSSQSLLGAASPSGTQAGFQNAYHGQETAAYNAAGVANGAAYQQAPTAADAAREYILQNNMPEYAAHQAEGYMNVFANMFLSGNSTRAHTSLGDAAVGTK